MKTSKEEFKNTLIKKARARKEIEKIDHGDCIHENAELCNKCVYLKCNDCGATCECNI